MKKFILDCIREYWWVYIAIFIGFYVSGIGFVIATFLFLIWAEVNIGGLFKRILSYLIFCLCYYRWGGVIACIIAFFLCFFIGDFRERMEAQNEVYENRPRGGSLDRFCADIINKLHYIEDYWPNGEPSRVRHFYLHVGKRNWQDDKVEAWIVAQYPIGSNSICYECSLADYLENGQTKMSEEEISLYRHAIETQLKEDRRFSIDVKAFHTEICFVSDLLRYGEYLDAEQNR